MSDEAQRKPRAVVVHNPALSGCLTKVTKANHLDKLFPFVPNVEACVREHLQLVKHLREQNIKVIELFDVVPDESKAVLSENPNIIFTRDPSVTFPWQPDTLLICNMKTRLRAPEPAAMKQATEALGFSHLIEPPETIGCEGGDIEPLMIKDKKVLLIRTGNRTDSQLIPYLLRYHADVVDEIVEVRCLERVLHLDSAFGLAGTRACVYDKSSIMGLIRHEKSTSTPLDPGTFFAQLALHVVPVSFEEAYRLQATNLLNVGQNTAIAYSGCERVVRVLKESGVTVLGFDGHELAKGNGGPRCLTRPIYD
jgi:N-dimethylarginine dimethylaminohydrolase